MPEAIPLRRSDDAQLAVLVERLDQVNKRFDHQDRKLEAIHAQTKLSNGRLSALELKDAVRTQREFDANERSDGERRNRQVRANGRLAVMAAAAAVASSVVGYLFLLAIGQLH